jgi:hypothetical protein
MRRQRKGLPDPMAPDRAGRGAVGFGPHGVSAPNAVLGGGPPPFPLWWHTSKRANAASDTTFHV